MKTRMKNINIKVDQSVKTATGKNYIPLFPITAVEELKWALVKRLTSEYTGVATRLVYQAINEAYALAALTLEPLLFLPALAEEKVQQAAAWSVRQSSLLHGNPLALAA